MDQSPPRPLRHNVNSSSPPRPVRSTNHQNISQHDQSPPRHRQPNTSPPRSIRMNNNSLPRPTRMGDNSPPRPTRNDHSPPRPTLNNQQTSPPRPNKPTNTSPPRPARGNASPPRPTRDISPPRPIRGTMDISPPRPSRSNHPPPRPSRSNHSPPRPSRSTHSPPRPTNNHSPSRPTNNHSPPRPTNNHSPPRPSRPNHSPPRPSRQMTEHSPPRPSVNNDAPQSTTQPQHNRFNPRATSLLSTTTTTTTTTASPDSTTTITQPQFDEPPPPPDYWAQVSNIAGHSRYSTQAARRVKSTLENQQDAPPKYQDPLYLAHVSKKKEKILKIELKVKEDKLLLEQLQWDLYQEALAKGDLVKVRELEDKQRLKQQFLNENIDNHIRIQALQIIKTSHRDQKTGNIIKMVKRPVYNGQMNYTNRFNIPPGYRWDGIDRSVNALAKQRDQK